MEKYGVDLSELPVDDDQLRKISKIASEKDIAVKTPKNKKEAERLIEELINS